MSKFDDDDNYIQDRGNHRGELNSYDSDVNSHNTQRSYDNTTHRYDSDYNDNIVNTGIDNSKKMAAAGIAGAGAIGAGIVGSAKNVGNNIADGAQSTVDGVKDFGHRTIETTADVKENITSSYNNSNSLGQEIGIRPSSLQAPRGGEVDDLKEISGIGLKIEEVLNSLGIYHFDQIADWEPENVEWIENYLSVKRRVLKEDWIGQARLLATGGQTEFSKKVRRGENRNYK